MKTHGTSLRRIAALILMAALIIMSMAALSVQSVRAEDNDGEGDGDKPEITIEVVEEIPAAEIEEQEVPLADTLYTDTAGNTRTTVISWTIGTIVIAYLVFLFSGMSRRKKIRRMLTETLDAGDSGTGER